MRSTARSLPEHGCGVTGAARLGFGGTDMKRRTVVSAAIALALTVLAGAVPISASADSIDKCERGKTPQYVFGFADLSARLTTSMGAPITCEFPDPKGTGDVHQQTRRGLAFWRKSTNTPTFTNGSEHWGKAPSGWVEWSGSSIDPPKA